MLNKIAYNNMKKILRNLMTLLCVLTALVSCSENGDKIYLDGFSASSLMASGSYVTLSLANKDDVVLSMAWKNPTLLSSDETMPATSETLLTYLQVSATQDFATTKDYTVSSLSKAFIGGDLNAAAKELGLTPNQSAPLYFRIKSQMGANLTRNRSMQNDCCRFCPRTVTRKFPFISTTTSNRSTTCAEYISTIPRLPRQKDSGDTSHVARAK